MKEILQFIFSGFWPYLGSMLILIVIFHFFTTAIIASWRSFMTMLMVRKHGWPPRHFNPMNHESEKFNPETKTEQA